MRLAILAVALAFAFPSAHCAEPAAPTLAKVGNATFARGEPLPAWAEPLAAIPPSTSRDPVVTRLSDTQVWTGSGPTAVLYNRAIEVNHRARLGEIGQFALTYLPSHQKLALHRVALLRGTATIDLTQTVNARLLERESNLDHGTYGGETTVQLLLDDVRVGDTLWITYTVTGDNPVFDKHWGDWFSWEGSWPVLHRRLLVSHPAGKPLYWRELGDAPRKGQAALAPVVERRGAIERLRFEGRDIAPVEFERRTPPGFIPVRLIALSDFKSWHDVAQWATALFPATAPSARVQELAAQFRGAGDQDAQAAAALHWVQEEIRYFSVSIGENSHRPQAPDTVLARRYGDCKDKSYLLIAILQALGIAAEPVLLSANAPTYPAKVPPTHNAFDHAIVRLHVGGRAYFVDPTQTGQRGSLAQVTADFPGASVLVVAPATQALTVLPAPAPGLPSYERIELFKVADYTGPAVLETRTIYRNSRADDARRKFGAMRAVEVGNDVLGHYERQYPGVTLTGTATLVDDAPDGSFEVRARLAVPGAVRKVDQRYVLDYDSQVVDGTLALPDKLVRQFPLSFPEGKLDARYRLRVQWPANVRGRAPDSVHLVDHPYFSVRESYSVLGNEVDYLLDYRLKRDDVAAADLPELQRAFRTTQGLLSGSFNSDGGESDAGRGLSMRNFIAGQQLRYLRAVRADTVPTPFDQWEVDDLCWYQRSIGATLALQTDEERAATRTERATFARDARPRTDACRGQLALQDGDARAAAGAFGKETLAADDRLRLQWSWAQYHAGQADDALRTARDYVAAAQASGKLNGGDLALATSLHRRAGKPVPAMLTETYILPADGPWPAPLLAWQRGALTEAALLATIAGYAPDVRALAANDAWFHIGVARLAAHDAPGAAAAWRWYQADGVRTTLPDVLAGLERRADGATAAAVAVQVQVQAQVQVNARDPAAARSVLEDAVRRGDPKAMYELSMLYRRGLITPRDPARLAELERVAAEMDEPAAQAAHAFSYLRGSGVARNDEMVRYWAGRALANGSDDAYAALAGLLLRGSADDQRAATNMVRTLAGAGNFPAMIVMGHAAMAGLGQPADPAAARAWYVRAQQKNGSASMKALYQDLAGRDNDKAAAFDVARLAAEDGDAEAQHALATHYRTGAGTAADPVQSVQWLRAAVRQGNAAAINDLGDAYETGTGVKVDLRQAMLLYHQAAQTGEPGAFSSLAHVHEAGIGTPPNLRVAYTYRLLEERFVAAAKQAGGGATPGPATLALAGRLSAPERDAALAVASAWQPGQPLPDEGAAPARTR